MERSSVTGGVRLEAVSMLVVIQESTDHRKANVSRAHAVPQETCDNLINALKLLTNQENDGDCPVGKIVSGLLERSRSRIMDELRKFIAVNNHGAVKVGDLHRETSSKKVVKPKFTADFPGAVVREGADELTLRAHEEGVLRTFIDTSNVGDQRWVPPSVDADWHAFCQAIFQRVEGPEWESMYYHYKDLHHAVKSMTSGEEKKAKVLWAMKEKPKTKV